MINVYDELFGTTFYNQDGAMHELRATWRSQRDNQPMMAALECFDIGENGLTPDEATDFGQLDTAATEVCYGRARVMSNYAQVRNVIGRVYVHCRDRDRRDILGYLPASGLGYPAYWKQMDNNTYEEVKFYSIKELAAWRIGQTTVRVRAATAYFKPDTWAIDPMDYHSVY
jgi:hypothetical protein